jgi:DNA transformation protein
VDTDRTAEVFATFGPVRTRRMFGGTRICAEGLMFALEACGSHYMKADIALAARLAAEGSRPFMYGGRGKPVRMSYWRRPDAAPEGSEDSAAWARAALEVAQAAKRQGSARLDPASNRHWADRPHKG